ncbi:MAG: TetR/AcrR family transcriptional regulator [Pseudomonadales bacterium]|nr:TetR/AcrR family transcriptional regulator [Pseudomonadales bacterium]
MKAPTQPRARQTIDRILDAAELLFDRDGFDATTLRALAEEADLSTGAIYQWFPGKAAIAEALAERHVETAGQALLARASNAEEGWRALIADVLTAACDAHAAHPRAHRFLYERAPRIGPVQAALDALERGLEETLIARLVAEEALDESEARHRAALAVRAGDALLHGYVLDDALPDDLPARLQRAIEAVVRIAGSAPSYA